MGTMGKGVIWLLGVPVSLWSCCGFLVSFDNHAPSEITHT